MFTVKDTFVIKLIKFLFFLFFFFCVANDRILTGILQRGVTCNVSTRASSCALVTKLIEMRVCVKKKRKKGEEIQKKSFEPKHNKRENKNRNGLRRKFYFCNGQREDSIFRFLFLYHAGVRRAWSLYTLSRMFLIFFIKPLGIAVAIKMSYTFLMYWMYARSVKNLLILIDINYLWFKVHLLYEFRSTWICVLCLSISES